jgi:hypothetical protein
MFNSELFNAAYGKDYSRPASCSFSNPMIVNEHGFSTANG